jgi:DNA adenine methylase
LKTASPLRYPGGKAALTDLLIQIRKLNGLGDRALAEPYAGGAGASLSLLYLEETSEIFINDADPSIRDFWWAVVHRSMPFVDLLSSTRVSMAEWLRQRDLYRSRTGSRLQRGFSAFYLNRCNHSGIIIDGGPIGGVKQLGEWKLNARFNKTELRRRCERVAEYGERIHVSGLDGIDFIHTLDSERTMFLIDPPYFVKGQLLYMNALDESYHVELANTLKSMPDAAWVLTYDDCPEIRRLYRGWAKIRPFTLRYNASGRRHGKELLIVPSWMRLPTSQTSGALAW